MKKLLIDITSICPHKCIYCYHQYFNKTPNVSMSPDMFYRIIDIAKKENYSYIYPIMSGEMFTHPHIYAFLKYLIVNDMDILIATKFAVKIDFEKLEDVLKELNNHKVNLNFRLEFDCYNQETADQICKLDFEQNLNNYSELYRLSLKYDFKYHFQTIVLRQNEDHLSKIQQIIYSLGFPQTVKLKTKSLGYYKAFKQEIDIGFLNNIIPVNNIRCDRIKINDGKIVEDNTCYLTNWFPIISPEGNLLLCCHDMLWETNYGSVIESNSIDVLFNSDKYQKDMALGKQKKLLLCKGCN